MKILVIGGGGREHTLVWKLAQSPKVNEIFVAPGNAGTAKLASNIDINPTDIQALIKLAHRKNIDLTVVGPEVPLAEGISDQFLIRGMQIFGPTKQAAHIESSKVFAKELMKKHKIPCAKSASFSSFIEAREYVKKQKFPIVVKADGLSFGKGVTISESIPQALGAIANMMERRIFQAAGDKIIIEEYLTGKEMSCFAFTDGHTVISMIPACDYKKIFDGDQGPNTGGMGSYSPPHFFSTKMHKAVMEKILEPTVKAMHQEGRPYRGILYGGLMITTNGLKVLEFNARFGDPESQVTLPQLKTDLVDILLAVANNSLDQIDIKYSEDACVGVVMSSAGYPDKYRTGFPITGLDDLDKDIIVFHGATKITKGQIVTNGGRVLTIVATGKSVTEARDKIYQNISRIHFEGCYYRKDIALIKE
ncbi:phosphoribosylamine--glycine ligase [Chloroflexota bacterium]